jgi:hypothetical protein
MKSQWILAALAVTTATTTWVAASETRTERDVRMAWWREAKFGMFVHWGIYSVTGGEYKGQRVPNSAEWMMNRGKIPIAEYEQYAAQFNPTKFDADGFVALAKEAGMRYIVITAKHHDGFSMFGSKASRYNVVEATPFKRDIMMELGAIDIAEADRHTLRIDPDVDHWQPINLRHLELKKNGNSLAVWKMGVNHRGQEPFFVVQLGRG